MVSQPCSEIEAEQMIIDCTSIEYLRRRGLLGPSTVLGHCVHVSEADIESIASAGASLAHMAVANLYLGSGIAPIPEMLAARVTVGLGTDNANCNNSVSILREMAVAALIHRGISLDPSILSAQQVLAMATVDGARAIGCDHLIGSIEPGKRADIVILDIARANMTPLHEPASAIVYQANGADVDTVIVDGRVLLDRGVLTVMTADEEAELRVEAQRRSTEIMNRAAIG